MELIKNHLPEIRFLYDLKDVLYDQNWLKTAPNLKVYYMYRDLAANAKEHQQIKDYGLRYDITIIDGHLLGSEFPKTLGHDHGRVPETNLTYPEIYEVLEGQAYHLIQKQKQGLVEDVFIVKAKKGDKVIIPPNYGHVTINASSQELKAANWTFRNFQSDYSVLKEKHGACYYALSDKENSINWLKNDNYQSVPPLKIFQATDFVNLLLKLAIDPSKEMYRLVDDLEKLDFLKSPQKYDWSLS